MVSQHEQNIFANLKHDLVEKKLKNIFWENDILTAWNLKPKLYRIFAHIHRRKKCFSNNKTIALICRIEKIRTLQNTINHLEKDFKMVKREIRYGKPLQKMSSVLQVASLNDWATEKQINKTQCLSEYSRRELIFDFNKSDRADEKKSIMLFIWIILLTC